MSCYGSQLTLTAIRKPCYGSQVNKLRQRAPRPKNSNKASSSSYSSYLLSIVYRLRDSQFHNLILK